MMNKRRLYITPFLIVAFFLLETSISFSDRGEQKNYADIDKVSFTRRLNNELSVYDEFKGFDRAFSDFLDKWNIRGASVAIAKEGKMVYAKGFGYANAETGEHVQPYHQFRVASVSKLITAIAIMKLVEEGKIALDDKVFGKEGILRQTAYWQIYDHKVYDITVKHLLEHSGGWTLRGGDPLFMPLTVSRLMKTSSPPDKESLMKYVLSNRRLGFLPGTRSIYSNFGYIVLGEIIREVTDKPYETYIQQDILNPLGIYDMKLGKTRFYEKDAIEVKYYEANNPCKSYSCFGNGKLVQRPYGGNSIELLSSAGGWIASPAELLKLVLAADQDSSRPDILSEESIRMMTYPYRGGTDPFGWKGSNVKGLWWRTGSFSGTSALIMKQPDNTTWVVLLNTSTWKGSYFPVNIFRTMIRGLNRVKEWPEQDLFVYGHPSAVQIY
jgi:CubicO group peptidase (beta-lactamase class C family)